MSNETTRDALVGKLEALLDHHITVQTECNCQGDIWRWVEPETVSEIVRLVTAARDAEIRELLLSIKGLSAFDDGMALREVYFSDIERGMESALDHIGLGDSDTGGQG